MAGLAVARAATPQGIARQLPPGFDVLSIAAASLRNPTHTFYIVALGRHDRESLPRTTAPAPARPLLVFERRPGGSFLRVGRNDTVILRADEGGQCDPFLDEGATVAVKGRYFTVENGVACGNHWTDYVTFRFEASVGQYVFDNERFQSWTPGSGTDPDAEALVADGPPSVRRGDSRHPVTLDHWRRTR